MKGHDSSSREAEQQRGPSVHYDWTVQQTLEFLRSDRLYPSFKGSENSYHITINSPDFNAPLWDSIRVVDEEQQDLGDIPLCSLVCASPSTLLTTLLPRHHSDDKGSDGTINRRHSRSDSSSDDDFRLSKSKTSSSSVKKSTQLSASTAGSPHYFLPIMTVVKKRIGWLMLLFLAETFTGSVLRMFEHELSQVVALSFFVPLLIGTGGNSGSQVVTTVVRALATKRITTSVKDMVKVVIHESVISCILGCTLGIIGFVRALIWGTSSEVAAVVGCTLPLIVIWANAVGSLVPMLVVLSGQDPAVVSAPFITTLVDATGLAIYFSIAKLILGI